MDVQEIKSILYDLDTMVELAKQRCNTPRFLEIVHSAIEIRRAVEKQTPKGVKKSCVEFTHGVCPTCRRLYWEKVHVGNYCDMCGQKLKEESE